MYRKLYRFWFLIALLTLIEFRSLHTFNPHHYLLADLDQYHKKYQRTKVNSLAKLMERKNMNPDRDKPHKSQRRRKLSASKVAKKHSKIKERNLCDLKTHLAIKLKLKKHHSKIQPPGKKHSKSRHLSVHLLKRKPKISRALKVAMNNYYTDVKRRRLMMPIPPSEASIAAVQAPGVVNSRFVVNSVGVPPSSWYQGGPAPVGYGKPDREPQVIVQRFKLPGNTPVYKHKLMV